MANTAVEKFMALPRSERRAKWSSLSREEKAAARKASETRRGIAFRASDGEIVFTKEALVEQARHFAQKAKLMASREKAAKARLVELKNQARNVHGDEFLAELENALEQ